MTENAFSWISFVSMLPSIVTAVTAVVGVKFARDGLNKWHRETIGKRRAELAEETLADFYKARDIINSARSPLGYSHEGQTRQRAEWETEHDSNMLDAYYRTAERLYEDREFWSQLHARRYRFQAILGLDAAKPFDALFVIRNEITVSVQMLLTTYPTHKRGTRIPSRDKWSDTIGWLTSDTDEMSARLNNVVTDIETVCQPIIKG